MKTLLLTLGFLSALTFGVQAQSTVNTSTGAYQNNELNPSSSGIGDGSFNPFNLIHNANFNRGRDSVQFQQDTQDGINKQAEEFKRLQQQQIQQSPPAQSPNGQ